MAEELRSLYLIAGTDGAKIDATRARLRARAESEGGSGSLEVFEAAEGRGAPDHEALLGSLPAMSLTGERRYLLADGVERWRDRQLAAVAAAVADLPPDLRPRRSSSAPSGPPTARCTRSPPRARGRCREPWSPTPAASAMASSPR